MKKTVAHQADKMKVRNADERLNEILKTHKRNTATRRELLRQFWLDVGDAKLRVEYSRKRKHPR